MDGGTRRLRRRLIVKAKTVNLHLIGKPRRNQNLRSDILIGVGEPVTTLYRPVGSAELALIQASGFRAFPPRLPEQPIFYPVLSEEYATQVARDWNTKDELSGFAGYVLKFRVRAEFLRRYDIQVVGSSQHKEYWIPAADLTQFNASIVGKIEVVAEFHRSGRNQS